MWKGGGVISPAHLLRRVVDALVASDPGLGRLRMGASGALCVAAAMAVEYLLAGALHAGAQGTTVFMLLGSVVAMIGANALLSHKLRENLLSAVWFPVAVGVGLVAGALLAPYRLASLVAFVVVMYLSVWMRRFGLNFFFYGFMLWMGFFFASFLGATVAQLPAFLLAVVVGTAVVLLLCCTVFRPHPRRTLARVFRSMHARERALARACASLLQADGGGAARRASRAVFEARARVNDASLMSDGWAAHQLALPEGWTSSALRARLLELQLGLDRLTLGTRALAQAVDVPAAVREGAARALELFADDDRSGALRSVALLVTLADGTEEAVRDAAWNLKRGIDVLATVAPLPELSKTMQRNEREFVPAATLVLGQLPGSPSVASGIHPRGGRLNPLRHLSFTSRQAAQVAIAGVLSIIVGSAISGERYYWAVIAAFVAFAGTGTRFDTVRKSLLRVLGTLLGLIAGVLIAHLTNGHTFVALVVIVASIFCGNYLMRISYAYMIFFLTIMLSELYSILGEFSDSLLVLRLIETAAGAGVGIVVALLVTPVSTRDTIRRAQRDVVAAIAEVLDAARRRAIDPAEVSLEELDERLIAADGQLRRLMLVGAPLTRYQPWENRPRAVRRRLTVVAATVAAARMVVLAVRELGAPDPALAEELAKVGDFARRAADAPGAVPTTSVAVAFARDLDDTRTMPIAIGRSTDAYSAVARLQALLEEFV